MIAYLLLAMVLKIQAVTSWHGHQTSSLISHLVRYDPSFTDINGLALLTDSDQIMPNISRKAAMLDIASVNLATRMPLRLLPADIASHYIFIFQNDSSLLEAMSSLKPQVFSPDYHYLFITNFVPPYRELSYNASWSMYKHLCFAFSPKSASEILIFVSPRRIGKDEVVTTAIWLPEQDSLMLGSQKSVFLQQSPDFQGKELLVTTFNYPPKIYEQVLSDGSLQFSGYEVMIVRTLAQSLNFVPVFRKSADGVTWGGFFDESKIMNGLKGIPSFICLCVICSYHSYVYGFICSYAYASCV